MITKDNYNQNGKGVLAVPYGNDFKICLCPQRIAPMQHAASFADIGDLSVRITRQNWEGRDTDYELTNEGDIVVKIPPDLKRVTYGLEISGTYNGHAWRWKDCSVFNVTECNPCGNVGAVESFSADAYYIYDDIIPSFKDDTLILETHAHAWVEGETLCIQASENTDITVENETLTIQYHGNIKNESDRPSRQCYR